MARRHVPTPRVWIWTAATLALVVVAALLWRGSDAAATESTTAAPAGVPEGAPAAAVSEAWQRDGDPLPEDVVEGGRVLLGSASGVRAVDPSTGDEAWHYTRSNARLCGTTAVDGVVVAVFRTEDRCDEAVALDAGTGVRRWTRNVSFRGDATLESTSQIVLATSPTGVVTLDPTGNTIRWRYNPPEGCLIDDATVGSAGVAVLQTCDRSSSAQLRLLDGFTGKGHWTRDVPVAEDDEPRLLGAGGLLGLAVGEEVQVLSGDDGSVRHRLPRSGEPRQVSAGGVELFLAGGTLRAFDPGSGAQLWRAAAVGLPAPDPASSGALVVPVADGFSSREPRTGEELERSAVAGVPAGGTASAVGPVVVLQLDDGVLAYS